MHLVPDLTIAYISSETIIMATYYYLMSDVRASCGTHLSQETLYIFKPATCYDMC